jgi:hypothetical protein
MQTIVEPISFAPGHRLIIPEGWAEEDSLILTPEVARAAGILTRTAIMIGFHEHCEGALHLREMPGAGKRVIICAGCTFRREVTEASFLTYGTLRADCSRVNAADRAM